MKLEEVLPAMREGRVGIWSDLRFIIEGGKFRCWNPTTEKWGELPYLWADFGDGWTLEPEPKVEWPKGSIQWAIEQAGEGGKVVRRGWVNRDALSRDDLDSAMHLDWEVVP